MSDEHVDFLLFSQRRKLDKLIKENHGELEREYRRHLDPIDQAIIFLDKHNLLNREAVKELIDG